MSKQSVITQESLIGALDRLLKEKPFENISISELTKVAGISRMTFYRHYHNQLDVLAVQLEELLTEFNQAMVYHNNAQYILDMVHFFQTHSEFIKLLLRANQEDLLYQKVIIVMGKLSKQNKFIHDLTEQEFHYYVSYHTAGLMNVIVDWIRHDQPESAERLAAFLTWNVEN